MSDGREERNEQEERRKWEEKPKDPDRYHDDREREWERDGDRERRDSKTAESLDAAVRAESGRRARRSFLVAAAAARAGTVFTDGSIRVRGSVDSSPDFNAKVARGVFDERGLAPTYPMSRSLELRDCTGIDVRGVDSIADCPQAGLCD